MEPLHWLLQSGVFKFGKPNNNVGGCVIVTLCIDKHPFVEVTVAVTTPLHNAVAVLVFAPLETVPALQLNVNGAVPEVTDNVAIALQVPLHNAGIDEKLNTGELTLVRGKTIVLEQPAPSVTTTV